MSIEFYNPNEFKERMENELKSRFEFIMKNLGLSVDKLQGKKILDIGAGERHIAAYCLKEEISDDVYSVEPNMDDPKFVHDFVGKNWPEIREAIDKKTFKEKRNDLSFKDESFDMIIIHLPLRI